MYLANDVSSRQGQGHCGNWSSAGQAASRNSVRQASVRASRNGKTAFVLAGGGSCGAAQVGMLRELTRHGIVPDFVVGTSVGAVNGAFFAGLPTFQGLDRLHSVWCGLRRNDVFPFSVRTILRLLRRHDSLIDPGNVSRVLERFLPCRTLESAAIPVHVVATDVASGEPIRLSSGSTVDALLASIAIPAILPPVRRDGRLLMDGGVASNTPVQIAIELGATRIFVLPTATSFSSAKPPRTALEFGIHAVSLMLARHHHLNTRRSRKAEIHTLPAPDDVSVSPFDFARSGELIESASRHAARWLSENQARLHKDPLQTSPPLSAGARPLMQAAAC